MRNTRRTPRVDGGDGTELDAAPAGRELAVGGHGVKCREAGMGRSGAAGAALTLEVEPDDEGHGGRPLDEDHL